MNGIRLAVLAVAAIGFLQFDLSEALAQRNPGQDMEDAMKNNPMGNGLNAGTRPSSRQDGNSRSNRSTRSRRSSRNNSSGNAIMTNPLFKLFDQNGDGELSLEEIDAASRMLYSLDTNEDDAITADEVEDMVGDKAMMDDKGGRQLSPEDEDEEEDRRTARNRNNSRNNSRTSRNSHVHVHGHEHLALAVVAATSSPVAADRQVAHSVVLLVSVPAEQLLAAVLMKTLAPVTRTMMES